MLYVKMEIPLEDVNHEMVDEYLWRAMSQEIKKNVGYEESYVLTFKKEIRRSESYNYNNLVEVILYCGIKGVQHENYAVVTQPPMISTVCDKPVKRIDRLFQFIKGV